MILIVLLCLPTGYYYHCFEGGCALRTWPWCMISGTDPPPLTQFKRNKFGPDVFQRNSLGAYVTPVVIVHPSGFCWEKKSGDLAQRRIPCLAALSLTSHEESPGGGSHIELEEIHDNQPKSAEGSGVTLVCPSAVPDQSDAQTEDLDKRNGAESAEDRRLQGVSKTGGSQSFGDEGEKIKEDMEFGEVNLSALYRELTVEKMWHKRTWFEVLKHFALTLMFCQLSLTWAQTSTPSWNTWTRVTPSGAGSPWWSSSSLDSFSQFGSGKLSR